jgi:hypothetical protein
MSKEERSTNHGDEAAGQREIGAKRSGRSALLAIAVCLVCLTVIAVWATPLTGENDRRVGHAGDAVGAGGKALPDNESPPKDWIEWAAWAEKHFPVTDEHGHGPDIGSDEWAGALGRRLMVIDADGHGPDPKSDEWRAAVESRLMPREKRELLSSHDTIAVFRGIREHRCLGLTALCPDRCGHSGKLATFEIRQYRQYEKPGEYGDPKQDEFQILMEDNTGKCKISARIHAIVKALDVGDEVHLKWNHDYVTRDGASYPERTIVELGKTESDATD